MDATFFLGQRKYIKFFVCVLFVRANVWRNLNDFCYHLRHAPITLGEIFFHLHTVWPDMVLGDAAKLDQKWF